MRASIHRTDRWRKPTGSLPDMKFGIVIFPTDTTLDPVRLAREVEARGFGSLWFPEHSHMPNDHSPAPSGGRPTRA